MKVEVLGSGGAVPIPRPGCGCRVCVEARADPAVVPMGIRGLDPLSGERRMHPEHPLLAAEVTLGETLAIVERRGAARVEETDERSHGDLSEVARRRHGRFEFVYDGMLLEV